MGVIALSSKPTGMDPLVSDTGVTNLVFNSMGDAGVSGDPVAISKGNSGEVDDSGFNSMANSGEADDSVGNSGEADESVERGEQIVDVNLHW